MIHNTEGELPCKAGRGELALMLKTPIWVHKVSWCRHAAPKKLQKELKLSTNTKQNVTCAQRNSKVDL